MEEPELPSLLVHNASRTIDDRVVLSGATLRVARGSIVGLLGPNGAGKTSLLRAVAGRLRLDSGEVQIAGTPGLTARQQGRLGLVPQDIALFAHLTVRENLTALGRLAGVPRASLRARVDEGLVWAGLDARADALVHTLSGGMRRRVNLVAGTLHRPALLLLDEPTVGVDVDARARLHDLVRSLRQQGMGVLLATHDADEAHALCDEAAVMAGGSVVVQAPIAQLVAEAFGGATEVSLVIEQPAPASGEDLLRQAQFRPEGEGRWVGRGRGLHADLDVLRRRLAAAGIRVRETRVSEPHLAGAVALILEQHARRTAA